VTASAIVDIKHAFIGGEGEPVGCQEIGDQQRHGAEIGAADIANISRRETLCRTPMESPPSPMFFAEGS
jgi:hypothetical protein